MVVKALSCPERKISHNRVTKLNVGDIFLCCQNITKYFLEHSSQTIWSIWTDWRKHQVRWKGNQEESVLWSNEGFDYDIYCFVFLLLCIAFPFKRICILYNNLPQNLFKTRVCALSVRFTIYQDSFCICVSTKLHLPTVYEYHF